MQSTPFAPGRAAWTITPRPHSLRARRGSVSRARRRPRRPSWARRRRRRCSRPESEGALDRPSALLHGWDHVRRDGAELDLYAQRPGRDRDALHDPGREVAVDGPDVVRPRLFLPPPERELDDALL